LNKSRFMPLAIGATVLAGTTLAFASYPGQQLAGQARVSLAQARSIATHAVLGRIVSQELEKESGGSGLRYSFDVKTAAGMREVGVDATTGAVLENSSDSAALHSDEQSENGGDTNESPNDGD